MVGFGSTERNADFGNEKKLIRSLKAMDEAAITWVWQTYYPVLIRYATRMTHDSNLADEIVSTVFERLIRSLHQGKGPQKDVKSYLYRMVYNAVIDEHRFLIFLSPNNSLQHARNMANGAFSSYARQEKPRPRQPQQPKLSTHRILSSRLKVQMFAVPTYSSYQLTYAG